MVDDTGRLSQDLEEFRSKFQCFFGVLNPWVQSCEGLDKFDVVLEYKDHFFCDLGINDIWRILSDNHKRLIKKALKLAKIARISNSGDIEKIWLELYNHLIAKRQISGISRFTPQILKNFIRLPQSAIYAATIENQICGITIFCFDERIVYYHLAAYSDIGYDHSVSYGIFWQAIQDFKKDGFKVLHLGGVPGVYASSSGLYKFKKGFSSGLKKTHFIGKILNRDQFNETLKKSGTVGVFDFFPPYRKSL